LLHDWADGLQRARPRPVLVGGAFEGGVYVPRHRPFLDALKRRWMLGGRVGANVLTDAFPATSDLRRSTLTGTPPIAAGGIGGR